MEDAAGTAETVARDSYGKLLLFLAARTGDVAGAEDALSDAFAAALADWPVRGVPDNPRGWLLAVARRRRIDAARRTRTSTPLRRICACWLESRATPPSAGIPDQRLALMFVCAHPASTRASARR